MSTFVRRSKETVTGRSDHQKAGVSSVINGTLRGFWEGKGNWKQLITWRHYWLPVANCSMLRAHGLSQQSLMDVFRATVESKIQYAAPAWSGFCTAGDRDRLNAFLRRDKSAPFIEDIFCDCDEQLFSRINTNSLHILHQYLPDRPTSGYSLWPWRHNKHS